jgi:CIC family chloride channel protein
LSLLSREENLQEASSELQEYLSTSQERRRLFPKALLVGTVAGLMGVAFRGALALADALRGSVVEFGHRVPLVGILFPCLFGAFGALLGLLVVKRWAPEAAGSGIPHLEAVLHRHRTMDPARVLPAKFLGGVFAISGGLALGREGPTVQMGGAVGMGVARMLKVGPRESLTLTAAGAGAGLTAAFNAPLSGLVFVLEELQRDFRPTVFGAAFLAAAAADAVARIFAGQLPAFSAPSFGAPSLALLPVFALLGAVLGVLGVVFNRTLLATVNRFAEMTPKATLVCGVGIGALAGLVAYFAPGVVGGGHGLAEAALAGKVSLTAIPLLLLLRFALTMGSYGTGAPGGIFAPLLVLGALTGVGLGQLTAIWFPGAVPGAFAAIGMAACFTGIVRAPLTGIVLIVEMTSSYSLMLPLLVACFCAYAAAEVMGDLPVYEALLQRDLLRGGEASDSEDLVILELEVQPGSPFDGRRVRELGLPAGVLLVGCREGAREWVPTADTVLLGHTRVTAAVSPEAKGGLKVFRAGCSQLASSQAHPNGEA